jgi:hypothetical protein
MEEHIKVFLFGLACNKRCAREGAKAVLAHSPKAPNELNRPPPRLTMGQKKTTSRYILSKQEGIEEAKKPFHAIVPL